MIWAPLLESCKIRHEINRCFLLSEVEKIVRFTFIFTSHKCWRWQHQNLDIFYTFIFHIKCMLIDIPRGVVVITTAQHYSTKPQLRFCTGSNPAHGLSEIRDGEDLWQWSQLEIRLNAFRRSTIPQKQFIIIIITPHLLLLGKVSNRDKLFKTISFINILTI